MRNRSHSLAALLTLTVSACGGGQADHSSASGAGTAVVDGSGAPLGSVAFASTCSNDATIHLERGLALLHSMTYEEAEASFTAATKADSACAMGYWGRAMSYVHPLWSDPPSEAKFQRGRALLDSAVANAASERERRYIDAVGAYYRAGHTAAERPNLVAFEDGWRAFHEAYPDDIEGMAFYALSQLATVDPADKTFSKQRAAGALAERVLARVPDHPGGHHYIIHAYDNPALSAEAVDVARSYRDIAPQIPHALHMPTHTFTRLGLWHESIVWNRRSADAALARPPGEAAAHYLHALDYLAYAYLQRAEDDEARAVLEELETIGPPYLPHIASAYAFAAVPARLALERQAWDAAAGLAPRDPSEYPWASSPQVEAISHFARALGAARSGRSALARQEVETLATVQKQVTATSPYWGTQIEIQRLSALAWLHFEEGAKDLALQTMRQAADLESGTEKHPVTPGEVIPARELLADMLLELGRAREAMAEYAAVLERSPNRFNSLYGAGRAAELAGDSTAARTYYSTLINVTAPAAIGQRVEHARTYVEGG